MKYNIFLAIESVGTVIAALLSASANNTTGEVIFHALLGWIYVIYYVIVH
jgi:hypothetical protein